jgi:hypothetical protein
MDKKIIPKTPSKWNQQEEIKAIKNIFKSNICENCKRFFYCETKKTINKKYQSCYLWIKGPEMIARVILSVLRQNFPNKIADKIFSEQPMEKHEDSIFYIKYKKENIFKRIVKKIKRSKN